MFAEKSQDEKKSKIPMLRLRQAVEKVKRERQAQKARGDQVSIFDYQILQYNSMSWLHSSLVDSCLFRGKATAIIRAEIFSGVY